MSRFHFAAEATKTSADILHFLMKCNEAYSWGSYRFDKGLQLMDFLNLVMLDWDPSPSDTPDGVHYTISSTSDVEALLTERVVKNPDEFWVTYLTPSGGVHAFLLSHKYTPLEAEPLMRGLKCDLLYVELSLKRNRFGVRISPKPNRLGDYVASYWKTFGNGIPLPEHLDTLKLKESYIKGAKYLS
jgi:hypothetical protein